jgi:hypothetical protein
VPASRAQGRRPDDFQAGSQAEELLAGVGLGFDRDGGAPPAAGLGDAGRQCRGGRLAEQLGGGLGGGGRDPDHRVGRVRARAELRDVRLPVPGQVEAGRLLEHFVSQRLRLDLADPVGAGTAG